MLRTPFVYTYSTQPGSIFGFVIPIYFAHGLLVPPLLAAGTLNLAMTDHTNAFGRGDSGHFGTCKTLWHLQTRLFFKLTSTSRSLFMRRVVHSSHSNLLPCSV